MYHYASIFIWKELSFIFCAGVRPRYSLKSRSSRQDHPRVCGNYPRVCRGCYQFKGSPPRVRELLGTWTCMIGLCRITPACAGITLAFLSSSTLSLDHPRVCGNYSILSLSSLAFLGSPPRVRELLKANTDSFTPRGITPACAGITSCFFVLKHAYPDHPRVCGNY